MRSGLRAGAVAATLVAASYCFILGGSQYAVASPRTTATPAGAGATATAPAEATATDTRTELPGGMAHDVLVDDVHQQVFVSMSHGPVVVTDLDGRITRTVTGSPVGRHLILTADASAVYAANNDRITRIDTVTYEVTETMLPEDICVLDTAFTGGRLWFTHTCSADGNGIGVLDTNTGEIRFGVILTGERGAHLRALPDRPDRLTVANHDRFIGVYDVSTDPPTAVAERPGEPDADHQCSDTALTPDAAELVTACYGVADHEVFRTSDLSSAGSVGSGRHPIAVAVSPGGGHVAAGVWANHGELDIFIMDVEGGTPGTVVRQYDFPDHSTLANGTLEFGRSGRLYAVEEQDDMTSYLHVLADPTRYGTTAELSVPRAVPYRGTVTGSGLLSPAPGEGSTVTLVRRDRNGERNLGTLPVAADGGFEFTDEPEVTGPVVYRVDYDGDADHAPASDKAGTTVRPLPYDINADGYADVVVGAPGEDLGTRANAGSFHVLYGRSTGVTGAGSIAISQDTAGVPGINEAGDRFGYSNTSGDFNGDGYADVAVSAGSENIGSAPDGGMVWVFYGSAEGLRTDNVGTIGVHDTFLGSGAERTYFGDALASGDFDGDGRDDLAIGAAPASQVFVAMGSPSGLSRANLRNLNKDTPGVPGVFHSDDMFGWTFGVGDVDGDGRDDLAVGAIYDYEDRGWSTGSVTVFYGGDTGLTGTGSQRFTKDTEGVPGSGGSFDDAKGDGPDDFGHQVVLADFNADGRDDLAVAAHGAPVKGIDGVRRRDAGTVTVLYAAADGRIGTAGARQFTQASSGMPGNPAQEDHMGTTLAAGDTNGDGAADLAIYSYGDHLVTVVPGSASGLVYADARAWTQDSPGIPGATENGDRWGNSLRFGYVKGGDRPALLVGADGENSDSGALTVIYCSGTGLTGTGAVTLSQNSSGIPGSAEDDDGFGTFF